MTGKSEKKKNGKVACQCKDEKINMPKINAGFELSFIHSFQGYTGKTFIYCPWCSKKLKETTNAKEEKRVSRGCGIGWGDIKNS